MIYKESKKKKFLMSQKIYTKKKKNILKIWKHLKKKVWLAPMTIKKTKKMILKKIKILFFSKWPENIKKTLKIFELHQ